jgi:hypothetical protein
MNHVMGCLGYPHLGFPRDIASVPSEGSGIEKGGYVDAFGGAGFEHRFKFSVTLWRNRTV